jgi:hypothetical protein
MWEWRQSQLDMAGVMYYWIMQMCLPILSNAPPFLFRGDHIEHDWAEKSDSEMLMGNYAWSMTRKVEYIGMSFLQIRNSFQIQAHSESLAVHILKIL